MEEYNDITETGYNSWSDLQDVNEEYQGISDYLDGIPPKKNKTISDKQRNTLVLRQETLRRKQNLASMGITPNRERLSLGRYNPDMFSLEDESYVSPMANTETPFGESRYDKNVEGLYDLEHLQDIRADNQSGLNKLAAGTAKAAVLAGTTWLDGTVGFIYGLGAAAAGTALDLANGTFEWNGSNAAKIFDNELSNGFQQINQYAEKILPNYRSELEDSRQWYQNMGTANFWADFLKQVGFTVGAMYSGMAWTKALKAINMIKSPIGAKVAGSLLSGINEGRIEANQIQNEHYNKETELLDIAFNKEKDDVMRRYYNGDLSDGEANAILETLYNNNDINKQKIKDNSDLVGLIDLAINVPILTLDNMLMFGKAYSRGFNNANKAVNSRRTFGQWFRDLQGRASENLGVLENEVALNVEKTAAGYGWNTITKGLAALKGMGHFLREGNEEMMQAYASELASALYQPDSPDSYYQALYDPNALDNTKSFYQSAVQGFSNSYGNLDRWQEFVMGGLTGLLGTVTFGKSLNQSPDTYVGKGKRVGVTGGLLGELAAANYYNQRGLANVDFMNDYVQSRQKDFENKIRHFAMSDHYNSLMNGWAEESNKYEYENAKDNDDFEAFTRFNNAGRLQDFKDMIDQDFTDLSDEDLDLIAKSQDNNNQWKNPDGTYMSETPEGRAKMREKLEQNRQDLIKGLEYFEDAYESIVNVTNDNLTNDQNLELAWLKWKVNKFNDRFENITSENKPFFKSFKEGLQEYVNAFDDSVDESKLSDEVKENDPTKLSDRQKYEFSKRIVNNARELIKLVDYLDNSRDALEFLRKAGVNYKTLNQIIDEDTYNLFAGYTSMTYDQYHDTVQNLLDAAKLGIAANEFDERLKQYMSDPSNIEKQHSKIRQKVDLTVDKVKSNRQANSMMDMDIEVLSDEIDNGNLTKDENGDIFNSDGLNITKNVNQDTKDKVNQKFDEANGRVLKKNEIISVVMDDEFGDNDPNITLVDKDVIVDFVNDSFKQGQFEHIQGLDIDAIDDRFMLTEMEIDDPNISDDVKQNLAQHRKWVLSIAVAKSNEQIDRKDSAKSNSPQEAHTDNSPDDTPQTGVNDPVDKQKPINTDIPKLTPQEKKSQQEQQEVHSSYIEKESIQNEQPEQQLESTAVGAIPMSELPLSEFKKQYGIADDDYRRYGEIIADLTKYDFEQHEPINLSAVNYTPEFIRYVCETDKFLYDNRAYENRYNKSVSTGKQIHFGFSRKLNDAAETNVILILDESNNIIGNLNPFENDPVKKPMIDYLNAIINDTDTDDGKQIYELLNDKNERIISYINNEYIGIIPYSKEFSTLNQIFKNPNDIRFGIVKESSPESGVFTSKSDNQNHDVRPPKKSVVGQVFALLKSGSSQYPFVTVNIFTPRYGDTGTITTDAGNRTLFDRYVSSRIDRIVELNNKGKIDDNMSIKIKDELNQIFSDQNFGVESENGRITSIHIGSNQGDAETKRTNLYSIIEGELTSQILYDKIVNARLPINISLGNINKNNILQSISSTYNSMIAEISQARLVPGTEHTLNDFFTIDLLDEKGNVLRTEQPKKKTITSVRQNIITLDNGSQINKDNWDVIENGITYSVADDVDIFVNNKDGYEAAKQRLLERALEYTSSNRNLDETQNKVLNLRFNETFYLLYNILTKELIIPLNGQIRPLNQNTSPVSTSMTLNDMDLLTPGEGASLLYTNQQEYPKIDWLAVDVNTVTDWFNESVYKDDFGYIWDDLEDKDKKKIYSVRDMLDIDEIFRDYEIFGKSENLNNLLNGGQFRQVDSEANQTRIEKEETEWLKQFYPELSKSDRLKITKGFIKMSNDKNAWGMFNRGMIVLSDKAASGTLYHEAFHSISHTLLTQDELNKMLDVVRKDNPNMNDIELEEILAEDFRGYMQTEVSNHRDNVIVRAFKMLKNFILGWRNKQYVLTNMYYRISQGMYAGRGSERIAGNAQVIEYGNTKNDYENLSDEQKQYLNDNQVAEEQYNKLTDDEKENFWYCIS